MANEQVLMEGWAADMTQRLEGYDHEELVWASGKASPTLTVRSPNPDLPDTDAQTSSS